MTTTRPFADWLRDQSRGKTHDELSEGLRDLVAKVIDVAAHYGITLTQADAHGAEADALTAGRIAWAIASRYPGATISTRELHDLQVTEKRRQAESFGLYLRRQGKVDDVAREWPIQRFPAGWSPEQVPDVPLGGAA